ncbi:hypothetical protein MPNT_280019 [Candidatus Methylacidithermus pantelleriae]|uniref:Uncharacterized protein n=1 Tax=Candidatus Methylacidithermus pantelleriae TaxID=2744239 RepID=A0A8J2BT75_9BACT|nr:hypothetical protein MPNT_280019 [Candidatus Methylacidithermus pantelleriae]
MTKSLCVTRGLPPKEDPIAGSAKSRLKPAIKALTWSCVPPKKGEMEKRFFPRPCEEE